MPKHYSYFLQVADGGSLAADCRSLQIYSDVPAESLAQKPVGFIDVARWGEDGCELYDSPEPDARGVHRGRCKLLWGGVGTDVPYSSQYFPFVPVGEGVFEAISEVGAAKGSIERIDRITFGESGEEVTLTRSYTNAPERLESFRFKRLPLEARG